MLAIIVIEIMMIFEGDRLLIVKVMNVHIPFLFLNFFGRHFSFHVALHPRYATYTYDTFIHTYILRCIQCVLNSFLSSYTYAHRSLCSTMHRHVYNSAATRTFVVGSKIVCSNAFNSNKKLFMA